MNYSYSITKTKPYIVTSSELPTVKGFGKDQESAFNDFLTNAFQFIRSCLKNDAIVPFNDKVKRVESKTFGLPLNMALKIKLHNIRLAKKVSRKQLAQILSVTDSDMKGLDWNLNNLRNISIDKLPKYKNVQRLFDLNHESTVREIESAYRVLGFNVTVVPQERT